MGQANARQFAAARELFAQADAILELPLTRLCFEGPQSELDRTDISQPALYTAALAALAAYRERHGELADGVCAAGLSLGEYTALCAAGAIDFADGLRLVRARGAAMQSACDRIPSAMASIIGLERATLAEIVEQSRGSDVLVLANINSPQQIAISGSLAAVERASTAATRAGAKLVVRLQVAGAFHSPLMAPAAEQLAAAIAAVDFRRPRFPIASNIDGNLRHEPEDLRSALRAQLTGTVEWVACVAAMRAAGATTFYEFGPGKVLSGLMKRIDRQANAVAVEDV
jgi:[acyl-carrier-protein] S-malonyltransferase